jgi:UDP-GlcNAc:undecaprenyl-phosphate GlcNAc-1-phosphate transferase
LLSAESPIRFIWIGGCNLITTFQQTILILSTFLIVGLLVPQVRKLALRLNFVDKPNSHHKTHAEPVPYLGGVAIMIGITSVTYAALLSQNNMRDNLFLASTALIPSLLLGFVGLIDDRKALPPFPRFLAQSSAGGITALLLVSTDTTGNPTGRVWIDVLVTVVWIVGICNSINFFDNLDGGAAGTVATITFGLFLIAQQNGQLLISSLSLTILGGVLGFLVWNKSPAKIYMGDAGSLFLGTLIGVLTVRLNPSVESKLISLLIPILLLAVPLLDTAVAILSRIRRGASIFQGGRDHLSHRLIRHGFTKKQAAALLWSLSGIFVSIATTIAGNQLNQYPLVILSIVFWLLLLGVFLKSSDA